MTVTTHRTRSNVTTLKELRDNLGTKVNEAVFSGERPLISRNGKTVAALISYEDLKLLEEYEELLDIEALRKARAEDDGYRIGLDEFLEENPAENPADSSFNAYGTAGGASTGVVPPASFIPKNRRV